MRPCLLLLCVDVDARVCDSHDGIAGEKIFSVSAR